VNQGQQSKWNRDWWVNKSVEPHAWIENEVDKFLTNQLHIKMNFSATQQIITSVIRFCQEDKFKNLGKNNCEKLNLKI